MAAKTMPKGLYKMEITEIDGPKAAKSQKSINYFVKMKVVEGDFLNKELTIILNTATKTASQLGDTVMYPERDFMRIYAATKGLKTLDDVPETYDTDELMHVPFEADISLDIIEGNPTNLVRGFYTAGTAGKAMAF